MTDTEILTQFESMTRTLLNFMDAAIALQPSPKMVREMEKRSDEMVAKLRQLRDAVS